VEDHLALSRSTAGFSVSKSQGQGPYLVREIYHLLPPLDAITLTAATPAKLVT